MSNSMRALFGTPALALLAAVPMTPACAQQPAAPTATTPTAPALVAANMQPTRLSDTHRLPQALQFPEGPLWMNGTLWVSDVNGGLVWGLRDSFKAPISDPGGGPNGQALLADGTVVRAMQGWGRVVRVAADGRSVLETLAEEFEGKALNSPNDVVVKSDGSIYFTDPTWGLAGRKSQLGFHGIYRIGTDKKLTLLGRDQNQPNGIAFSPDEKTLYVSDVTLRITAYDVKPDGTLGAKRDFGPGGDGIKVDRDGNVWATMARDSQARGSVLITSPKGENLGRINLPGNATNLTWGGADGTTLFVTTTEGVFRVPTNTSSASMPRR
jgi:sugar lactone lactonase YvrE